MKHKANKSALTGKIPSIYTERRHKRSTPAKKRYRWLYWLTSVSLFFFLVLSLLPMLLLRWVDPPISAFMLQQQSSIDMPLHYDWVRWNAISAQLKIAVLAAEDQRFPEHFGFDFKSINDALQARQTGRSSRGASTISQQVVKNLFLWPGKSWLRKGIEAWLTLWLECTVPKQRILEIYLNIAQWGENQFGAQAASEVYFAKNAAALSRREAALLAAVLPNPVIYRADNPSHYVLQRQRWILQQIRGLGGTTYLSTL